MSKNRFAASTLKYIWTHPNCRNRKFQSVARFLGWQLYKRIARRSVDITLVGNTKLRCYPNSYSGSAALYCGLYDYNEMKFLLRYLQDGDSFLDVGANIGVYTLLAATKSPSGKIYSIEALSRNAVRLEENVAFNQFENVILHRLAISDRQGKIFLYLAEGDSMPFVTDQATHQTIEVQTDTLDSLLAGQTESLVLAKMDIEGAELLALRGASSLLRQCRPMVWILEINNQIQNFDYTAEDLLAFLDQYDYGLYSYDADVNQVSSTTLAKKRGNNVLAIARPSLDLVLRRLQTYSA